MQYKSNQPSKDSGSKRNPWALVYRVAAPLLILSLVIGFFLNIDLSFPSQEAKEFKARQGFYGELSEEAALIPNAITITAFEEKSVFYYLVDDERKIELECPVDETTNEICPELAEKGYFLADLLHGVYILKQTGNAHTIAPAKRIDESSQ